MKSKRALGRGHFILCYYYINICKPSRHHHVYRKCHCQPPQSHESGSNKTLVTIIIPLRSSDLLNYIQDSATKLLHTDADSERFSEWSKGMVMVMRIPHPICFAEENDTLWFYTTRRIRVPGMERCARIFDGVDVAVGQAMLIKNPDSTAAERTNTHDYAGAASVWDMKRPGVAHFYAWH